jgi:hypothetical protein
MSNAFGPYNRVMMGAKAMVMACAPAVPEATTTTFRTNLLFQVRFMNSCIPAMDQGFKLLTGSAITCHSLYLY